MDLLFRVADLTVRNRASCHGYSKSRHGFGSRTFKLTTGFVGVFLDDGDNRVLGERHGATVGGSTRGSNVQFASFRQVTVAVENVLGKIDFLELGTLDTINNGDGDKLLLCSVKCSFAFTEDKVFGDGDAVSGLFRGMSLGTKIILLGFSCSSSQGKGQQGKDRKELHVDVFVGAFEFWAREDCEKDNGARELLLLAGERPISSLADST